jgi:hypothetical protein
MSRFPFYEISCSEFIPADALWQYIRGHSGTASFDVCPV